MRRWVGGFLGYCPRCGGGRFHANPIWTRRTGWLYNWGGAARCLGCDLTVRAIRWWQLTRGAAVLAVVCVGGVATWLALDR